MGSQDIPALLMKSGSGGRGEGSRRSTIPHSSFFPIHALISSGTEAVNFISFPVTG